MDKAIEQSPREEVPLGCAASDPSSCLRTPRDGENGIWAGKQLGATGSKMPSAPREGAGKAGRLRDLP